jgi:hypothetical protein
MRYILAILFPWLCFFSLGKPAHGIISLVLQISIIGWPIAIVWAFFGISEYRRQRKAKLAAKQQAKQTEDIPPTITIQETRDDIQEESANDR